MYFLNKISVIHHGPYVSVILIALKSVIPGPPTEAALGSLLEMQIMASPSPTPTPTKSEIVGQWPSNLCFQKHFR